MPSERTWAVCWSLMCLRYNYTIIGCPRSLSLDTEDGVVMDAWMQHSPTQEPWSETRRWSSTLQCIVAKLALHCCQVTPTLHCISGHSDLTHWCIGGHSEWWGTYQHIYTTVIQLTVRFTLEKFQKQHNKETSTTKS